VRGPLWDALAQASVLANQYLLEQVGSIRGPLTIACLEVYVGKRQKLVHADEKRKSFYVS
jgi:hypothetical protein